MQATRKATVRFRERSELLDFLLEVSDATTGTLDLDQLHLVGGTEPDIGAFPSVDVANDRLDERAQIARRPMMHFEHNGRVAIVFDGHSSAKIVGGRHGLRM